MSCFSLRLASLYAHVAYYTLLRRDHRLALLLEGAAAGHVPRAGGGLRRELAVVEGGRRRGEEAWEEDDALAGRVGGGRHGGGRGSGDGDELGRDRETAKQADTRGSGSESGGEASALEKVRMQATEASANGRRRAGPRPWQKVRQPIWPISNKGPLYIHTN